MERVSERGDDRNETKPTGPWGRVQLYCWYRQRKPSSASKPRLPRSIRVLARARRLFGECEKFVQKLLDPGWKHTGSLSHLPAPQMLGYRIRKADDRSGLVNRNSPVGLLPPYCLPTRREDRSRGVRHATRPFGVDHRDAPKLASVSLAIRRPHLVSVTLTSLLPHTAISLGSFMSRPHHGESPLSHAYIDNSIFLSAPHHLDAGLSRANINSKERDLMASPMTPILKQLLPLGTAISSNPVVSRLAQGLRRLRPVIQRDRLTRQSEVPHGQRLDSSTRARLPSVMFSDAVSVEPAVMLCRRVYARSRFRARSSPRSRSRSSRRRRRRS
ncbi:hypothetical protein KC325_g260 [Hortaea werneckii]|nr:hypothetical protein KC325_g260 [Hortaea werneckii]